MFLMLVQLIYCASRAKASGDFVDDCKYAAPWPLTQTRCGDQCIGFDKVCFCGEERLQIYGGLKYCCVDPSPDNITQCSIDISTGFGICPQGRVLNKTDPCNGHCYNDYHASEQIGYDSQFRCDDKCVPCGKCAEVTLDV